MQLIDAVEKHGENWEEITKIFNGRKTKQDCLLHLIQLPIKDNIIFKLTDLNKPSKELTTFNESNKFKDLSAINDQNNPIISQVVFFAKMFDKFVSEDAKKSPEELNKSLHRSSNASITSNLPEKDFTNVENLKEVIYRTYSKSIDRSEELKNKEKKKMEKIMNLLVYLQMKKIEMKLDYFNEFEKLIQYETQGIKTMESQIIQDRIKLAIKKSEVLGLSNKLKEQLKREQEVRGGMSHYQGRESLNNLGDLNILSTQNIPNTNSLSENQTNNNLIIEQTKENEMDNALHLITKVEAERFEQDPRIINLNKNNTN